MTNTFFSKLFTRTKMPQIANRNMKIRVKVPKRGKLATALDNRNSKAMFEKENVYSFWDNTEDIGYVKAYRDTVCIRDAREYFPSEALQLTPP